MSPHQNLAIRNAITATTPTIKADINNAPPANPKYSMVLPHLIRFGQGFEFFEQYQIKAILTDRNATLEYC